MLTALLQEAFQRLGSNLDRWHSEREQKLQRIAFVREIVEEVVAAIDPRMRAVSGYSEQIQGPVERMFLHIDALVNAIPGPIRCDRSAFANDPRVNAFFASVDHLKDVLSGSQDVQEFFQRGGDVLGECFALLCMQKQERHQPGMALVGDEIRRDVMQTGVSFTRHQLVAPGGTEAQARQGLKCCIFHGMLDRARGVVRSGQQRLTELESRRRILRGRLRSLRARKADKAMDAGLAGKIEELEAQSAAVSAEIGASKDLPRTLDEQVDLVARTLARSECLVNMREIKLRLNRFGIKIEEQTPSEGAELQLPEIEIEGAPPRIAALVCFPRTEVAPRADFLKRADLFLAV